MLGDTVAVIILHLNIQTETVSKSACSKVRCAVDASALTLIDVLSVELPFSRLASTVSGLAPDSIEERVLV